MNYTIPFKRLSIFLKKNHHLLENRSTITYTILLSPRPFTLMVPGCLGLSFIK